MPALSQKRKTPAIRNLVGLEIRRIREEKGWSQSDLARSLQLAGWDVDRTVLTKIELRRRCITDYELLILAKVLGTTLNEFVPRRVKFDGFYGECP